MAHMKKRMTFHGVDYIVVPEELWLDAKELVNDFSFMPKTEPSVAQAGEVYANMLAYEGSNEPEELQ